MVKASKNLQDNLDSNDFAAMLSETVQPKTGFAGKVVNGRIIAVLDDVVVVDVGLKSEGRISKREFGMPGQDAEVKVGDTVEVFVERMEDREGYTVLSREKARREEVWVVLDKQYNAKERVTGVIFARVKGGFTVDLGGAVAFLPGSQVDIRPVRDVSPLMGTPQPFMILKMDRQRGNIVVSRRAVLEESREASRSDLMAQLREGQVVTGVVKNITDYGAFIDLGGVDGLLHVTDISWKRVNHPSESLTVGQSIQVQIIRYNEENQRISLGMKQLESDPWVEVSGKYKPGMRTKGRITNITDYGAFVELEPGIEGLVHVTEMSWTKKNVHPNKIVSTSQEVDVQVLDIDMEKRRISLGIKQTQENPWADFAKAHHVDQILEGEVRNITEFGLFVGMPGDIDGMVHLSDISWEDSTEEALKSYKKGDVVKVKILDIDPEKERVALGIKQLSEDTSSGSLAGVAKGQVVTGTVTAVSDTGVEVQINETTKGIIKRADLSRERSEQRPDRFAVGEKVDAKVTGIDAKKKTVTLSIKQRELDEDKAAMAEFGSADSGASLGDILGAALKGTGKPAEEAAPKKKASKKSDEAAEE